MDADPANRGWHWRKRRKWWRSHDRSSISSTSEEVPTIAVVAAKSVTTTVDTWP